MTAVLAILRGVPVLVWVVVAAVLWGGWNYNRAKSAGETLRQAQAAAAAEEAQALRATITETERRLSAQQEIASAAQARADTNARAAAAARATADRVRSAALDHAAIAAASNPGPAGSCAATEHAAGMFADLLGRTAQRAALLADLADRTTAAGKACEAAYDALRPK